MKNIAIVEDEQYWITHLRDTLLEWSSKNEEIDISIFFTGEDIICKYDNEKSQYDMIFLDVKLQAIDGLETARKLREMGYENELVIVSNHQNLEYIQQGFDVDLLQYYTKPITYKDIEKLMARNDIYKSFLYTYGRESIAIPYKSILYFESARNYIIVRCLSPEIEPTPFRESILSLSTKLPKIFIQCHRSYIVNIKHVVSFKSTRILLHKSIELPMGKSYIQDIAYAFQNLK